MQDPSLMGWNLYVSNQSRIAPDAEGVVREAARANKLSVVIAELQAGDLRACVDAVDSSAGSGVPEMDVSVV